MLFVVQTLARNCSKLFLPKYASGSTPALLQWYLNRVMALERDRKRYQAMGASRSFNKDGMRVEIVLSEVRATTK